LKRLLLLDLRDLAHQTRNVAPAHDLRDPSWLGCCLRVVGEADDWVLSRCQGGDSLLLLQAVREQGQVDDDRINGTALTLLLTSLQAGRGMERDAGGKEVRAQQTLVKIIGVNEKDVAPPGALAIRLPGGECHFRETLLQEPARVQDVRRLSCNRGCTD